MATEPGNRYPIRKDSEMTKQEIISFANTGQALPIGATMADKLAVVQLEKLVMLFHAGDITQAEASCEKNKIFAEHAENQAKLENASRAFKWIADFNVTSYAAMCALRKDPSPERALQLCRMIDGFEPFDQEVFK